jgi:hypothetical protein
MTEVAQNLLVCYRRTRCISDYHAATEQLRLTLDYCGGDHPDRAAALTNLADALAIHPQIEESESAINAPISLYQQALGLRQPGHPDRSPALLRLGLALLYRFHIRKNPADAMEGQELLNRAQGGYPDDNVDTTSVIGASRSATITSIPRSHCSTPVSTSPPSPLSQMSAISTLSQLHTFPEAAGRIADISTRSAPVPMRMVNGEPSPRHGRADPSGDEKEFTAVSWNEIKAPSPAPSHSGIPYINSVMQAPHLASVISSRECSPKPMTPPVDMRAMQSQHAKAASLPLTPDPFLPLPMPAAQAPKPFLSNLCIALVAFLTSLFILLFMTCSSYLRR